jgi:hypothetical protein
MMTWKDGRMVNPFHRKDNPDFYKGNFACSRSNGEEMTEAGAGPRPVRGQLARKFSQKKGGSPALGRGC